MAAEAEMAMRRVAKTTETRIVVQLREEKMQEKFETVDLFICLEARF